MEALRAAFDDPSTADMRVVVDGRTIHVHKVESYCHGGKFFLRLVVSDACREKLDQETASVSPSFVSKAGSPKLIKDHGALEC